jgi:TonB family protein
MIGLLALAAAGMAAADAAPPEIRQPTGKWVVDFADAQCVAYRDYGTAEAPLYLVLKAPPLGSIMQLAVVRPGGGAETPEQEDGKIVLDGQTSFPANMLRYAFKEEKQRVLRVNVPLAQFDRIRASKTISFETQRSQYGFELSQLKQLLDVMQKCVGGLRDIWHVKEGSYEADSDGRQLHPALRSGAIGRLESVFSLEDYPTDALSREQQGTSTIAVLVDESGKVADCTVIQTSGAAILDAQSCAIIQKRARFKPAVDVAGQPAKDAFTQRVTWRLAG